MQSGTWPNADDPPIARLLGNYRRLESLSQPDDSSVSKGHQCLQHRSEYRIVEPASTDWSVQTRSINQDTPLSARCIGDNSKTEAISLSLGTDGDTEASVGQKLQEEIMHDRLGPSIKHLCLKNLVADVRSSESRLAKSWTRTLDPLCSNDNSNSSSDTALNITSDGHEGSGPEITKNNSIRTQFSNTVIVSRFSDGEESRKANKEIFTASGQDIRAHQSTNASFEVELCGGLQNTNFTSPVEGNRLTAYPLEYPHQDRLVHELYQFPQKQVTTRALPLPPPNPPTKTSKKSDTTVDSQQPSATTVGDVLNSENNHCQPPESPRVAGEGPKITRPNKPSRCCYPWRTKKKNRVYQVICLAAIYLASVALLPNLKRQGDSQPSLSRTNEATHVERRETSRDKAKWLVNGNNGTKKEVFCTAGHSMPADFLSPELASNGGWMIHIFIGFYMFSAVAAACDMYFVPALEHICEDLNLQADVAGATFMAAASSAPEFCTSVIGVFLAKSDIGLGAIVGSSIFNLLAIIGACAIFAGMPVQLSWYPLTRDSLFYLIAVVEMAIFMSNSVVVWPEALTMVLTYCTYIMVMTCNHNIENWATTALDRCRGKTDKRSISIQRTSSVKLGMLAARRKSRIHPVESDEEFSLTRSGKRELKKLGMSDAEAHYLILQLEEEYPRLSRSSISRKPPLKVPHVATIEPRKSQEKVGEKVLEKALEKIEKESNNQSSEGKLDPDKPRSSILFREPTEEEIHHIPKESKIEIEWERKDKVEISDYENPLQCPEGILAQCYWVFLLPVTLLHAFTIPDSRLVDSWQGKCYLLSFFLSVLYIAFYSYIMVWMITLAGFVWHVPTTVTGLTILAAGTSVPDCLSSVFVARDGYGDMAVSNAIGSNVFDILLCLGVPWLIDSFILVEHGTPIDSKGMIYAVLSLLGTIIYLWCSMFYVDWTLTVKYGCITLVVYLAIISVCIMIELNVFFELNSDDC